LYFEDRIMPAAKSSSTPADLTAALAKSPKAKAAFDALAPSHRREYTKWIEESKRPETRARRIEKTVAALAAGKKPTG
jgi:uncharacterized protein YdeI (YjbR/CyaY-like superfamily)